MSRFPWLAILSLAGGLAMAPPAQAQRPYIGFVYPAGGQQGTTVEIRLGGQNLNDVHGAVVSGRGVSAQVVEYYRPLGAQETGLLNEQLRELRKGLSPQAAATVPTAASPASRPPPAAPPAPLSEQDRAALELMAKIERRLAENCATPACASLSSLVFVEVTVAPDAEPGYREIRLVTPRGGASNPLVFCVGQLSEVSRKPMVSAARQILGKEELALRKRPDDEVEQRVALPCVVNGQIASGEVNRYRFQARKGQRLVISADARRLIPYVADAVPGWFQPVLALYDADGREVAYDDDYRFNPDPLILFEVPKDGEYLLAITDAIYRGREDFVYRVSIGETPFVTSIFPLGCRAGTPASIQMKGWNLQGAELAPPAADAPSGIQWLAARQGRIASNRVPFALDDLPECLDREPNNDRSAAQKVELPIIVNGHIDKPDDWDVFQFAGRAGDTVVAEVYARRLDSPLDSELKVTDPSGKLLAFVDDCEDLGSGLNTHHADSCLTLKLPADGTYCVHLGDAARSGGEEYGYRLRIGAPRPDFALRLVPSSLALRSKTTAAVDVRIIRKDGFAGPVVLSLKDPPEGFSSAPVTLSPTQDAARLTVRTTLADTKEPVVLHVVGTAKVDDGQLVREAVPAEDRMQAFLWRHLVPAEDLQVFVFDPDYVPPPKRVAPIPTPTP